MIILDYGNNDVVHFYCDKCEFNGEYDISNLITDNCAVDIEVVCELCKDYYMLYVLKCKDITMAKELSAKFEALKLKEG